MAANGISLESIMQHSKKPVEEGAQTIILVTHCQHEESVRKASASFAAKAI